MARQARARVSLSAPFALLVGAVRSPRRHGAATPTVHHHTCSLVSCAFQVVKAVAVTSDPSNSGLALHDPRSTLHTPHATHRALCPHPPTLEVRCSSPSHFPPPSLTQTWRSHDGSSPSRAWRRLDSTWRMPHLRATRVHGACRPFPGAGPYPHPAQQSPLSPARRCEKCVLCARHHMYFHSALGPCQAVRHRASLHSEQSRASFNRSSCTRATTTRARSALISTSPSRRTTR